MAQPTSPTSDFSGTFLSLDPSSLAKASRSQPVQAIEPDGRIVFAEAKTPGAKLTETLERIWNEYPNGLLDLTEGQLEALPPDALAIEAKTDQAETPDDAETKGTLATRETMTSEDMEKLRSEMFLQLNGARNELWFALELCKTLSQSASFGINPPPPPPTLDPTSSTSAQQHASNPRKKAKPSHPASANNNTTTTPSSALLHPSTAANTPATSLSQAQGQNVEPPIFPPGTYSLTPAMPPPSDIRQDAMDLELELAARQRAVEECGRVLDSAVEEMREVARAGQKFWTGVRGLQTGRGGGGASRWAIVPRPDFGGRGEGSSRARDVVVPYAIDEAPQALRNRSLAAFDLDPRAERLLTFSARSYHRLRVTITDHLGSTSSSSFSSGRPTKGDEDLFKEMEEAQLEAFDEDLWNEIRREVLHVEAEGGGGGSGGEAVGGNVVVRYGDGKIEFSLYDSRSDASPPHPVSPLADLVLSSARLSLLSLQRKRKRHLLASSSSSLSSPRPLLEPIVQALQFHSTCQALLATLHLFQGALTRCGIGAKVASGWDVASGVVQSILQSGGEGLDRLGGTLRLDIAGCPGIHLTTQPPSAITLRTSIASLPLSSPADLAPIVADDLERQLCALVFRRLKAGEGAEDVLLDTMEGVIRIGPSRFLRVEMLPPYEGVVASCRHVGEIARVDLFDSSGDEGLLGWAERVAHASPLEP